MEKIAQIRDQEVRGVLAALVDTGHVKCASREEFDTMSAALAEKVGFEYELADIVEAAGVVLGGTPAAEEKTASMQKNAAEIHESNCYAALGELLLMKTAGLVDDETFVENADILMKAASEAAGITEAIAALPPEAQEAVLAALIEEALAEEAAEAPVEEAPAPAAE